MPLWQLTQPLLMPEWVKVEGVHRAVVWQALHSCVVGICFVADLPVAVLPLWQLEQAPVMPE